MSSHDQAAETLRDFVSTQVRKMLVKTRDEAHLMRQAAERRLHLDRRNIGGDVPIIKREPVGRRAA